MPTASHRRRACTACTKAKRPCNKGEPRCERCDQRGKACKYPPPRKTAWDFAIAHTSEDYPPDVESTAAAAPPASQISSPEIIALNAELPLAQETDSPPLFNTATKCIGPNPNPRVTVPSYVEMILRSTIPSQEDWFYRPESWEITHNDTSACSIEFFEVAAMRQYAKTLQEWLRRWSTTGRCPFIHHRLYNQKFPSVIQDAYAVLSLYISRHSATTSMCFRIIQDHLTKLVEENMHKSASAMAEPSPMADPLDHVARVQALLVYEIICLFDGDITLREIAERHLPTLLSWAGEMWESAELDSNIHAAIIDPGAEDAETAAWSHWIVLESIRRTWITVALMRSVLSVLKTGFSRCSGGVKWTARAGLWDADDPYTWKEIIDNGTSPLFVPTYFADVLITAALPHEVDEIGHALLVVGHGLNRVAKWKALARKKAQLYKNGEIFLQDT